MNDNYSVLTTIIIIALVIAVIALAFWCKNFSEQIRNLTSDVSRSLEEINKKIDSSVSDISSRIDSVEASLTDKISDNSAKIESTQDVVNENSNKITAIDSRANDNKNKILTESKRIDALDKSINKLSGNVDELSNNVTSIGDRVVSIEKWQATTKADLKSFKTHIADADKAFKAMKHNIRISDKGGKETIHIDGEKGDIKFV